MHETIRTARTRIICDICGQHIFKGEKYRAIHTEEQPFIYNEHIQCPGAPTTVEVKDPRPIKPRINFNHAMCLA